jgi:general secretion pathway protein G
MKRSIRPALPSRPAGPDLKGREGRRRAGFTLVEMITVVVIISILAAAVMPLAQAAVQREREIELRRALRSLRTALDEYHDFVIETKLKFDDDTYGFPEKLEVLVNGIEYRDKENKVKVRKFLRRIPSNPFDPEGKWGMRSYQDKPDATSWGGQNIWDVYCPSADKRGLDGTRYRDW